MYDRLAAVCEKSSTPGSSRKASASAQSRTPCTRGLRALAMGSPWAGSARCALLLDAARLAAGTMAALAEHLDQLAVERRQVRGLAARHQAAIHHDLLVDPLRAGVHQVGFQRWPRGHGAALDP